MPGAKPQKDPLDVLTLELCIMRRQIASLLESDKVAARLERSRRNDRERQAERARALSNQARSRGKAATG